MLVIGHDLQKSATRATAHVAKATGKFAALFLEWSLDLQPEARLCLIHIRGPCWAGGGIMTWTAPAFEEVCLNCEINSYASAKL